MSVGAKPGGFSAYLAPSFLPFPASSSSGSGLLLPCLISAVFSMFSLSLLNLFLLHLSFLLPPLLMPLLLSLLSPLLSLLPLHASLSWSTLLGSVFVKMSPRAWVNLWVGEGDGVPAWSNDQGGGS